jgi:hypothetical protein
MSKISQKELLEEGFWDSFSNSKIGRIGSQIGEFGKSVANVVTPEITDPLKKGSEWLKNTKKNVKRAGMNRDQLAWEQIVEDGYYPLSDKMRWKNKANSDGTSTGSVDVAELDHDLNTGEPVAGRPYQSDKSKYIFKFDPSTRDIKTLRRPRRDQATGRAAPTP